MSHRSVIRIGLHKCGTTFFNHTLFPALPAVHFVGKPYPADDPFRELVERIIGGQSFDAARCREIVARHWRPLADERPVLLSDGRLVAPACTPADKVAARLAEFIGPADLILSVRRPVPLLQSLFAQNWDMLPPDCTIEQWLADNWEKGQNLDRLIAFDRLAAPFIEAFGVERVHIHLQEDMRADPTGTASFLAGVLPVDEAFLLEKLAAPGRNERISMLQRRLIYRPRLYAIARRIRKSLPDALASGLDRASGHATPYVPEIEPEWAARIEAAAAPGIEMLAARGLAVDRHGYRTRATV